MEVLGFSRTACRKTFRLIEETASEQGVAIRLEKANDPARIAACRVFAVPGIVMDGKRVYPDRKLIESRLAGYAVR